MTAFLLISAPLFFLTSVCLAWRLPRSMAFQSYLKGLLVCVPAFCFLVIPSGGLPLSYRPLLFYVHHLAEDFLIHQALLLGGFFLLDRPRGEQQQTVLLSLFAFGCGYMSLANVANFVMSFPRYESYVLFLLPIYRLCLVVATAILVARCYRSPDRRPLLVAGVIVLPFLTAAGAALAHANFGYISLILAALLAAGTGVYARMALPTLGAGRN